MKPEEFRDSPSGRLIRASGGYWAFIPNPLPPRIKWIPDLIASLSQADRALGELAGLSRSLPNPYLMILPFIRREAVLSSRIEGTRASLSDLYAYEAVQLSFLDFPSDVREVYNYVQALEYGLDRLQTLPVSLRLIREIHGRLMEGVRGEHRTPGEFRRSQNWIGPPGAMLNDAIFVPPPVTEMLEGMDHLEQFLHSPTKLPPLVRLGLVHYYFESIHPFLDGNGRVGRLLIPLLLCAWEMLPTPVLYLSAYFEQYRDDYYDLLLAVSQKGRWEAWLTFFLTGVFTQSRDAIARIRRLQELRESYRKLVQSARASARLVQAVDLLFARPILTIRQVEAELGVDFPAACRYIDRLQEVGILREITGGARNRIYRADEVMMAIEGQLGTGELEE